MMEKLSKIVKGEYKLTNLLERKDFVKEDELKKKYRSDDLEIRNLGEKKRTLLEDDEKCMTFDEFVRNRRR